MIRIPCWTAVAVVLALLAAGAAPARAASSSAHPPRAVAASAPPLSAVWDWLGSLVWRRAAPPANPGARRGLPPKAGCGMDPDGKAVPCPPK